MKKHFIYIIATLLLLSGCSSIHQHKYNPANYQQPETCSICGKTKGFELTPEFETRDLQTNMELNTAYKYTTVCSKDDTLTTEATVTVVSDTIITSDETHPAKDGYNYRIVVIKLVFGDFNSNEYGFRYNYFTTDYYDITEFTNSYSYNSQTQLNEFTLNYYGVDYPCTLDTVITKTDWKKSADDLYTKTITITQEYFIPEGYDGLIIGIRDSSIDVSDCTYIYQYYNPDQFLLYRMEAINE